MTETEWVAATDPAPMLAFLQSRMGNRKLRLFACACFRRIWPLLADERGRGAVACFERFADEQATADEFADAGRTANAATDDASAAVSEADAVYSDDRSTAALFAAAEARYSAAYGLCYVVEDDPRVGLSADCAASARALHEEATVYLTEPAAERAAHRAGEVARAAERGAQAALVRAIFGNPFRPVSIDPGWLTSDVPALAQGVYADRAFDRLPILADALQDAGCEVADILDHLRGSGPHVPGCWALDVVLGRE